MSVRVRFAPSPTGHLHIGSARTALFNWLLARHEKGTFILRIEDTDQERNKQEYLESLLADLRWLGLDWDEGPGKEGKVGPYFQSQRLAIYRKHADLLLKEGRAYLCWCAPEELAKKREKAQAEKRPLGYDGSCRNLTEEEKKSFESEGRKAVLRFRSPDKQQNAVNDAIRGNVDFGAETLEDFVIVKSDGFPVYNFACVLDDHFMEITHVLRGEEHLSNTPRQLLLYQAFGWEPPVFGHLSIILDERRKKLSKREGATYLGEFRQAGFLPEALLNFLTLLGWAPKENLEILPLPSIIERFGFDGIGKSPAIFDFKKLEWMNGQYIKALKREELAKKILPYLEEAGYLEDPNSKEKWEWLSNLAALFQERIKTLREIVEESAYFFLSDDLLEPQAAQRVFTPRALSLVEELLAKLEPLNFEEKELETVIRRFIEEKGANTGEIIHPLRLLITRRTASPGIFAVMALLGKEESLRRLRKGVAALKNPT